MYPAVGGPDVSFDVVAYRVAEADQEHSRITDLAIVNIDGTPHLVTTTRYDGVLQSWDITGGNLVNKDTVAFDGGDVRGAQPTITMVQQADGLSIQIGGGSGGALQNVSLSTDGTFGTVTTLDALPHSFAGLGHTALIELPSGQQVVYGPLAGEDGIAAITYSSTGSYLSHTLTTPSDPAPTSTITTTVATTHSGKTYLFTADSTSNTVTTWDVGSDGTLSAITQLTPDDGLWISAPQVMAETVMNGVTYIVLGAAGSSTISVMEVGIDGGLTIRDHMTDDRTTRFGGVTALEIVQHNGQTHIVAAGADDGVSIFQLLDGGYLVERGHIEDTTAIGLENVSSLAAIGRDAGLDIFAASSSEPGLTQLRYDTGLVGISVTATLSGGILMGTNANDILQGHDGDDRIDGGDGDDILRDGDGTDKLTGAAGADLFLLSVDGQADTITDFTLGEDKLDLSLWPFLRDISQLTMRILPNGFEITYGEEILTVESADGALIDYRELQNSDVLGSGIRLGTNIVPGYPGPAQPLPNTGESGAGSSGGPQASFSLPDAISSLSGYASQALQNRTTTGRDSEGFDLANVLIGSASDEVIAAGNSADIVFGRGGDDQIDGGEGADVLFGGAGADTLRGGGDGDVIRGGAGDDVIDGGSGDDLLIGGAGADTFIFNGGRDEITDFAQEVDQIVLDPALWTGLTSAADLLTIYGLHSGTQAIIKLDDANELIINGVTDYIAFADNISIV